MKNFLFVFFFEWARLPHEKEIENLKNVNDKRVFYFFLFLSVVPVQWISHYCLLNNSNALQTNKK